MSYVIVLHLVGHKPRWLETPYLFRAQLQFRIWSVEALKHGGSVIVSNHRDELMRLDVVFDPEEAQTQVA